MATPHQDPEAGTDSPSFSRTPGIELADWLAEPLARAVDAHSANEERETMAALETLCSAARKAGLPVEGILVPLKQLWQARTASDIPLRTGPTGDRLARLVSACITTYYSRS